MRRNKVTTNVHRQMQSWEMYLRAHGYVTEPVKVEQPAPPIIVPTFTSKIRGIAARVLAEAA